MPPCMSASIWTKWRLCIAIDAPCASVCEDLDCLLLQAKFIRAPPLLGLSRLVLAFVFAMIISAVSVLYKTSAVAILIWWPSFFSYFLVLCNQIRTGSRAEGRDRRGRGSWERDVCRVRNANWNWHFGQWPTKCFSELMAHKHIHNQTHSNTHTNTLKHTHTNVKTY